MANPDTQAAIYVRRSHKDKEGDARTGRSLTEQADDARALAARVGLNVVEVYAEREGTGASRHSRKARPVWEKALDDLDNGDDFRTLIVWALDRAERRGAKQVADLIERHAGRGRRVLGVDGTDTGDEHQRLALIVRAEVAREEAESISKRVRRSRAAARKEGRWQAGRPPYGLRAVGGHLQHDPATYPAARRIADMALDGIAPAKIASALNAEGIRPPRASSWTRGSIRQLLLSPAFAGLGSLRERTATEGWRAIAEVYIGEDGQSVPVGDGVITEGERVRILAAIAERTRDTAAGKRGVRGAGEIPNVLRGLVVCAECGGSAGITSQSANGRGRSYACTRRRDGGGCTGAAAMAELVDEAVGSTFLRRLPLLSHDDPDDAKLLAAIAERWVKRERPEADADHARLREQLEARKAAVSRLVDLAESGALPPEELTDRISRAVAARDLAARAVEDLPSAPVDISPLLDIALSREAWDALDAGKRRELLMMGIASVEITKAPTRGARFSPGDRVTIVWHTGRREPAGKPSTNPPRTATEAELTSLRAVVDGGDRAALGEALAALAAAGVRAGTIGPALGFGRSWADSILRRR